MLKRVSYISVHIHTHTHTHTDCEMTKGGTCIHTYIGTTDAVPEGRLLASVILYCQLEVSWGWVRKAGWWTGKFRFVRYSNLTISIYLSLPTDLPMYIRKNEQTTKCIHLGTFPPMQNSHMHIPLNVARPNTYIQTQ